MGAVVVLLSMYQMLVVAQYSIPMVDVWVGYFCLFYLISSLIH